MKKSILFSLLLLSSAYVSAVNPVALWMPVSLQVLMPQLMSAAEMAEATERCDKVMSGRHSSKRSTVERPVFSIVCRDAETKRTYSILYAVENGQVVEFNEQQRITGAKGETLARPWENPALKPIENMGVTPATAATAAPVVSTAPTTLATTPVQTAAPTPTAAPETPIDSRLAKLMARLEAAGVKGASAKVMMADMQKKTLEDNLTEYDEAQAKRTASPAIKSTAPIAAPVAKSPAEAAAELAKDLVEKSAPLAASAQAVLAPAVSESAIAAAEKPVVPATPAAEVSNAISTQLWSQCLPVIKTKTASMIDRVLDEKTIPAGYSADAGATNMDVPFEAKNPEGQSLRFLAVCTVDAGGVATVKLRPRRE